MSALILKLQIVKTTQRIQPIWTRSHSHPGCYILVILLLIPTLTPRQNVLVCTAVRCKQTLGHDTLSTVGL
jgi:hypothetical protein